jgi:putative membrane protein
MERALFRIIMTPAAIATALFGVWLMLLDWSFYQASIWFWIKIGLVTILYGYHFYCGSLLKKFARDEDTRSHTFYRWFNEIPFLILIAVTILVIVKPF